MLADTFTPYIHFSSLIVVDPILLLRAPPDNPHLEVADPLEKQMTAAALRRTDVWASREAALASLRKKCAAAGWDARIVQIVVVRAPPCSHGRRLQETDSEACPFR